MKKIFCMIIVLAMIVGGCSASKIEIESTQGNEIKISATNASDGGGSGVLKIPDGSAVQVDAKISVGKLIIGVGGKEYAVDKTEEIFIDVPAGECNLFFTAEDGLTGEVILRALPRI